MPEIPETPEEPQQGPPLTQESPKQRPTQADSTPGGVGAPLGSETFETRPLAALDALLQTNFMEVLPSVKGLKDLQPHAESHEPMGDDYIMALGEVLFLDHYLREYTKAGMTDAAGDTILFSLSVSNAKLEFGWGKAKRMGGRTFKESTEFPDAGLWDPVFMGITKSHTGTPAVQPDMDNSNVSNLYLKAHDITEVRRLEFEDTDESGGNDISLQQRGDAAGAILEVVNNNDATQYSSPTYRRLRLADPVGADDATTKRYVDALSYAGHTLLDASLHTDTLAAGVTDGSIVIGNATPKWSELVISIPAANVRNVLGIDNAELRPSWKTTLDDTAPTTIAESAAAAAGTSLVFSHRDHTHGAPATWAATAHNLFSATHGDTTGAANPVDGDIIIANATPNWSKLAISVPAANVLNVLGIANAELRSSWKTALDATNPADVAAAASPGTSLVFAHRDHVHKREHVKYTNTEAVAAVEAEDPLDLAGDVTIAVGKSLAVDTLIEKTAGAGISIDGLPIKDGTIDYSAALTNAFWRQSDFLGDASSNIDPLFLQVISGANASWVGRSTEASHPGIWQGSTGTTATGHAMIRTELDSLIFSNGRIRFGTWVKTFALSTAAQRYSDYVGIMDASKVSTTTDGIMLHYAHDVNGGKWRATVKNGGGATNADTGVIVAAGTWYFLEMEINAAGNSVEFFINGVSVATIASGPAANSTAEAIIGIEKTAGALSRSVLVDAAYIMGEMTVAR